MGSRSNPLATPTEQLFRAYLVKLCRAYLVKLCRAYLVKATNQPLYFASSLHRTIT